LGKISLDRKRVLSGRGHASNIYRKRKKNLGGNAPKRDLVNQKKKRAPAGERNPKFNAVVAGGDGWSEKKKRGHLDETHARHAWRGRKGAFEGDTHKMKKGRGRSGKDLPRE